MASDADAAALTTGMMPSLTPLNWPFVLTRRFWLRTACWLMTAWRSPVVSAGFNPSRAIFRMLLTPASPGAGSRNKPVWPCRYKMSPWPLTIAAAGTTCCSSACSTSSRSGRLVGAPGLALPDRGFDPIPGNSGVKRASASRCEL